MLAKIFTSENRKFYKTLITLSVPIVIQNFLNSMVNLADSFMIGSLGVDAINAVGFGNELFFLYVILLFGICSGASIYMGQYWGKNEIKSIHYVMGLCFIISMAASLVFCIVSLVFPEVFISFFSKDENVIKLGSDYLRIVAVTYILTAITLTMNTALRSINQTKIPMFTTFVALVINVVFNYIFIYIFKWGVVGAAIATAMARLAEVIAVIVISYKLKLPIAVKIGSYFKIPKEFIKPFFIAVVPVILNEFVWALGTTLYNVAYKAAGNEAQAAVRISASVQNLFNVIGMGIGSACGIMLANQLGANRIEDAVKNSRRFLKISIVISSVMCVLLLVSSPVLLSLYKVPQSVKDDAALIMVIIAFGMIIRTYNFTTIVGILRSGGDTKYCLMLDMLGVWLVGVPFVFVGAYLFKLPIYVLVLLVLSEEVFKFFLSTKRVLGNIWAKCMV